MINRETIWTETATPRTVRIDGTSTSICVFTGIHHYTGLRNVSSLNLCTELQIRIREDKATHVTEITLTPEDMEDLATYLVQAAQHARELKQMIDDDAAEIAAAAAEALDQAKEIA